MDKKNQKTKYNDVRITPEGLRIGQENFSREERNSRVAGGWVFGLEIRSGGDEYLSWEKVFRLWDELCTANRKHADEEVKKKMKTKQSEFK